MCNSDNDLAWLAGLFDGEGSVGFYRRSDKRNKTRCSYYIVAALAMTHAPTIERISLMFPGGSWTKRYGNSKHRNCFHWKLWNAKAREFLEKIQPYSFTKREEIRMALAADNLKRSKVGHRIGPHKSLTSSDMEELDTHVANLKLLKRKEYGTQAKG